MAEELKFPVVAHHRIIVNAAEKDLAATQELFAAFDLVEPVAEARASSGGKYVSFGLSVRLRGGLRTGTGIYATIRLVNGPNTYLKV